MLGDSQHIKPKFSSTVSGLVILVSNRITEAISERRKIDSHSSIGRQWVTSGVGAVVLKGAQGKRLFIHILSVSDQSLDEVSGADVVRKIAEEGV